MSVWGSPAPPRSGVAVACMEAHAILEKSERGEHRRTELIALVTAAPLPAMWVVVG